MCQKNEIFVDNRKTQMYDKNRMLLKYQVDKVSLVEKQLKVYRKKQLFLKGIKWSSFVSKNQRYRYMKKFFKKLYFFFEKIEYLSKTLYWKFERLSLLFIKKIVSLS